MKVRIKKEIGDLYNMKAPVIMICDSNTNLFGKAQDKIISGIENKKTSNNNSISFH